MLFAKLLLFWELRNICNADDTNPVKFRNMHVGQTFKITNHEVIRGDENATEIRIRGIELTKDMPILNIDPSIPPVMSVARHAMG